MDAATKARLSSPFHDQELAGTGLGLATVYGIVKQAAIHLGVHRAGHGTTFKIYLPRVAETAEAPESTPSAPTRWAGSETVLVVEDQERSKLTKRSWRLEGHGAGRSERRRALESSLGIRTNHLMIRMW